MSDIEDEMMNYREHFKGKVIYCNCDHYEYSNFYKYFKQNFKKLELQKLVATCYIKNRNGYKAEIEKTKTGEIVETANILKSDGDFRSKECVNILQEADIIITNPPFSLFRDYIDLVFKYNKKFIILGSLNAVTYANVFPRLASGELWFGKNLRGKGIEFIVPHNKSDKNIKVNSEIKCVKMGNVRWFTNLKWGEVEKIKLTARYNENDYPVYNGYDIINIDKIVNIPLDYDGIMGVPITFFDKYNHAQFQIIGIANAVKYIGDTECYTIIGNRKVYQRVLIKLKDL